METLWAWLLLAAVVGTGAGLLAGLLGVGGGIVMVPALYHGFAMLDVPVELRMHLAVGTSLAAIIPTAIRSALAHKRHGAVDNGILLYWGPGIVLGVLVGSWIASWVRGDSLTLFFGVVALVVAVYMAFASANLRITQHMPGRTVSTLLGSGVGTVSTLMGIGGGTLSVPAMTLCGVSIHRAVGTASALGLLIAAPGAAGFVWAGWSSESLPSGSVGYVNFLAVLLLVPATMLAAPIGARLAHSLPAAVLRRVFAFFLGATALKMLTSAWMGVV